MVGKEENFGLMMLLMLVLLGSSTVVEKRFACSWRTWSFNSFEFYSGHQTLVPACHMSCPFNKLSCLLKAERTAFKWHSYA